MNEFHIDTTPRRRTKRRRKSNTKLTALIVNVCVFAFFGFLLVLILDVVSPENVIVDAYDELVVWLNR